MCSSQEGSTTTECSISEDDDDSSSATKWMLITAFVWLGMMALVWLIYTCRKASRRRRLLKKTLVPLLKLLGLQVTFVEDARDEGRGEQPPPYELVTNSSPRFAGPPTYEEATGRLVMGRDVSVHDGSRSIAFNLSTTPQTAPVATSSISECDTTQRLASERHVTDDHAPLTAGPSSGDAGPGQMPSVHKCLGDANHFHATDADFCRMLQLLWQHSSTASVAGVYRESSPLPRTPPESYVTTPIHRDDYVTDDHESDQSEPVSTHAVCLTQSPFSREELDDNERHQAAESAQLSRVDRSSVAIRGSPFDSVSSDATATFAAGFDNSTQTDDHEDKQGEKGDADT